MQAHVQFALELDRLKAVTRRTRPLGLARQENSAEHSWQLALVAAAMAPHAAEPVNVDHVVAMLLVHDVGEIEAGDTFVYAEGDPAEKHRQEAAAVRRIFGLLPDGAGARFTALWEEFEAAATPEARFAHAVDRAMPVLLNLANEGQSWVEHGITYERVVARVGPSIHRGCPALWAHLEAELAAAHAAGWFGMR